MRFPYAYEGVKKIRTAELLYLIIAIGGLATAVMVAVASASKAEGAMAAGIAVLALALGIIAIVAFIINLIGLSRASKDEKSFKNALLLTLLGIILGFVSSAFSKNTMVTGLVDAVSSFLNVLIMIFVVRGVMNLATKLGNDEVIAKGNSILKKVIVVHMIGIIISVVGTVMQKSDTVMMIAAILLLIAAIIDVIVFFAYLKYLGKAVVMLEQ